MNRPHRWIAAFCFFCFASGFAPKALLSQDNTWLTPTEKSGYKITPNYADTMAYLRRVAEAAPGQVKIEGFGNSGEGRELTIVIASKDGIFDPAALHAAKRPIVLVQNSIHAGEMDGKDSCMALLRDMVITKTQAQLLDRAVFVFIPIYNADGHERRSPYNRINQNGPEEMGWRGNGTNLNLNRDYLKADAPETRAFLKLVQRWTPDFFVDDHVTDGADYQYDVTFTIDNGPQVPAAISQWVTTVVTPELEKRVDATGHVVSPTYITLNDDSDPAQGLGFNDDPPRFSTGYMTLQNHPAMLVELHMLKDYKTRVTGNSELLKALFEIVNRDADKLIAMNKAADEEASRLGSHPLSNASFPLSVQWNGETTPFLFRGYKYTRELSAVSGTMWVRYSHEPWNVTLPLQTGMKVSTFTVPPAAYILPPQWKRVIEVLEAHGVKMQQTSSDWTGSVEAYHCKQMMWQEKPFEGRHPIFGGEGAEGRGGNFGECTLSAERMTYPRGSYVVQLNQRLSKVAMHWLEPQAPDSAMRWGFFDSIFEKKEYGEPYVLEKLAREMMEKDPKLKAEFERKVSSDPQFAANPYGRLNFFYERSPWTDKKVGLYPVGRLVKLDGIPLQ